MLPVESFAWKLTAICEKLPKNVTMFKTGRTEFVVAIDGHETVLAIAVAVLVRVLALAPEECEEFEVGTAEVCKLNRADEELVVFAQMGCGLVIVLEGSGVCCELPSAATPIAAAVIIAITMQAATNLLIPLCGWTG